jgi:hypothetical protein
MIAFHAFAVKYYQWPVPEDQFTKVMLTYLKSNNEYVRDIGFAPGVAANHTHVAWMRASALSYIDKDAGGFDLEPHFEYWEVSCMTAIILPSIYQSIHSSIATCCNSHGLAHRTIVLHHQPMDCFIHQVRGFA